MKTKLCTRCRFAKVLSQFYTNGKKGLHSWCKECEKRRRRIYHRRNKKKENTSHRKWCIKNTYDLTLEQYDKIFEAQNGVCKICGKINLDGRRLYIDHNHKTKKVRGLLCHKCNSLLGYVDDSIDYLSKIKSYLKSE